MTPTQSPTKRLISQREACARTSLSRTAIWLRVKAKTFPKPVRLGDGSRIAYVESEIETWIEQQIAHRDEVAA
ncbi:helix-turn-helix transcriptional regulator [Mesorhizobium australicum]|uniref:helix-turn-helix transcriptional regulator n=1 Tax=Mesorhizobium australicum TaxID=536018 RepID=UPI0033374290